MASTKPIVQLRVYRSNGKGNQLSYNENREVLNQNQLVKLTHNTLEWRNYLKYLRVNGFIKVDVERVLQPTKDGYKEVKEFSSIKKEVDSAMNPQKQIELTPEQKKIAELEAKLNALTETKKATNKKS